MYHCIYENEFPEHLRQIDSPPEKLYYLGDIDLLNKESVAIVGSRKATQYGRQIARGLANKTASAGIVIVSGLAAGIDTEAHSGALSIENGKTIAVLGCGIDICYPAVNKRLYEKIRKTGLIISEYLPGTPPRPYRFPQRNRIISGISKAVVVVESDLKGGALITAGYALKQGKDVFAVPGNITSKMSRGTNLLIRDGAWPILSSTDILSYYGIAGISEDEIELSETEKEVLGLVMFHNGVDRENLEKIYKGNTSRLSGILTILEIKNCINIVGNKIHIAKF